jgi:hypothetical protein
MAIGSFIGGFAKRASEDLEDIKKSNRELVDFSIQTWVREGLAESKSRTQKRKETKKLVDTLKSHFSPDQVGVILKQGDGERIVQGIQTLQSQGSEIKPNEIVSFAEGYQESGLTYADIIDRYMGKVNSGVDSSTALAEATGSSRFMKKRIQAFENAFGVPMSQLRALAQQDIIYEDMPTTGTIDFVDPVAVARAKDAIQGTGTTQGIRNNFTSFAGKLFGGERTQTTDPITGQMVYRTTFKRDEDEVKAQLFADRANVFYADLLATNSPDKAIQLTREWMINNQPEEYKNVSPSGSGITLTSGGSQGGGSQVVPTMTIDQILAPLTKPSFKQIRSSATKQTQINMVRRSLMNMHNMTSDEADKLIEEAIK